MNPLITPASSLILPLSQLGPHCNRLLNSLNDGRTSRKEKILFEQTLWNEVKKIKALNDTSIFLHLIGVYHTILFQIPKVSIQEDLFQYHILIRLGDLNRYLERFDVAEYYYCNARNLFPYFGHAYNQLGLLTKPSNCYKCCYYYARAAKSSEKPLNTIADSNLRIAVSKYNCEILSHILNDNEACITKQATIDNGTSEIEKLPETPFDWFYVIVVAIYANNIQPITKTFLCYINENFSIQRATIIQDSVKITTTYCDRESYILLASLDILLDWLRFGSQGKTICPTISTELRQIRSSLIKIISSCKASDSKNLSDNGGNFNSPSTPNRSNTTNISANKGAFFPDSVSVTHDSSYNSATDSSRNLSSARFPALPHDYVLRGFSPLDSVHADLCFKVKTRTKGTLEDSSVDCDQLYDQKFIDTGQLLQITDRLRKKLDAFGPLVRKQTRNIALESILSNLDKNNGL